MDKLILLPENILAWRVYIINSVVLKRYITTFYVLVTQTDKYIFAIIIFSWTCNFPFLGRTLNIRIERYVNL